MTDERIPVPDGWAESEIVDDQKATQQRHPPAIFEHDVRDVAVNVRTDEPAAGEEVAWEVGIVFGDSENVGDVEPVERGLPDRQTAIERAKELMAAFNSEGFPEEHSEFDPEDLLVGEES